MDITKNKLLLIILLFVTMGTLIAIVDLMFSGRPSQNEPVSSITPTTSKTYHNEEFGFEFQYPADWTLHINPFYSPFSKFNIIGTTPEEKFPNTMYPSLLVNIVTPDFEERSAISAKNLNASTSTVTVGGVEGTKYEYKLANVIPWVSIHLPFESYRMILGANKKYEDIFNQILASFNFLK